MDDVHCLDSNSQSPMRDENINISDVIEVIETDPDFNQSPTAGNMYAGPSTSAATGAHASTKQQPRVQIVEQPASKALRFRYECEGRSAGSIPGANSTAENKTFPSIRIVGYKGKAVVVVSCVTKDSPFRTHPHNLVGREGCRRGVCTIEIPTETMSVTFSNLGIQCVKKKDIEAHLRIREEIRVDPFKKGFHHRSQPTSIDLNAVRLCFQVFVEDEKTKKFTVPLDPVVSDPIYDKKAMSDLTIIKLSDCVSPVDGGRKDIILLCEKVAKEDIQIRFFEEKNGHFVWEGFGDFQPSQVHKQTAIWFKTPKYKTMNITEPVKVFIQLRRPSDGATSEAHPFEFLPLDSGIRRKRKYEPDPNSNLLRPLQEQDNNRESHQYSKMNNIPIDIVKAEPIDAQVPYLSPVYGGNFSPIYANQSISPHQLYVPMNVNMGPTPPPPDMAYINITYPPNNNLNPLPSINNIVPNNWNMQGASSNPQMGESNAMNIDSASGLNSLLNLDDHQLRQIDVTSEELGNYNYDSTNINNLSASLTNNLSISDVVVKAYERCMGTNDVTQQ